MWCSERRRTGVTARAALFAAAVLLSACGFEPMYGAPRGTPNAAVQGMAETRIALIADRAGQELRNNLLDRMTPLGQPAKQIGRAHV